MAELEEQPHGGALKRDGNPGNSGGGRPKDRIRALAAGGGEKAVKKIVELLEDPEAKLSPTDLKGCCDVLLKYGIGTQQEVEIRDLNKDFVGKVLDGLKEGAKAKGIEEDMAEIMAGIEIPDEWKQYLEK